MTSKLYEEAIADSKKLKSLLREEVEKDLIEKMKPFMEQALNSEIDSFLMEQEEEAAPPAEGEQPAAEAPPAEAPAEAPATPAPAAPAAPITPVGGQMNMPLPDESGMVTVTFADLFAAPVATEAAPMEAPAEEPVEAPTEGEAAAPAAPETPAEALQEAKRIISSLQERYNRMVERGIFGLKEKTDFTYKLVEGYSQIETLKDIKMLNESTFNVLTDKMENLFELSKKSNKTSNSYSRIDKILEGKNMKVNSNTKSLINSLLESLETGYGKDGSAPTKYSRGVGVSKAERAGLPAKPKAVDPGRGRTAMFSHEAEVDEDLLKEVAELEEELEEMEAINELEEGLEEMDPPAVMEEVDECGMGYEPMHGGDDDKELTIRIVADRMDEEMEEGVYEDSMEEGYGMEEGDEVYEISMDETGAPAPQTPAPATQTPATQTPAPATQTEALKEVASLRENLASNEHLLARSILANKIFAEYDLSRKQKQLVVEYLDRAENVKDATRIYGRIKKQLVEAAASAKATETKTGSLNESVSRSIGQPANAASRIVIGSADRFRELVAGNKNSR